MPQTIYAPCSMVPVSPTKRGWKSFRYALTAAGVSRSGSTEMNTGVTGTCMDAEHNPTRHVTEAA